MPKKAESSCLKSSFQFSHLEDKSHLFCDGPIDPLSLSKAKSRFRRAFYIA